MDHTSTAFGSVARWDVKQHDTNGATSNNDVKSVRGMATLLFIWWFWEAITAVKTKQLMQYDEPEIDQSSTACAQSQSFSDLRWLELTCLQHCIGGIIVYTIYKCLQCTKALQHKEADTYPHAGKGPKWVSLIAPILGHTIGGCALNSAYSLLSTTTTQVMKTFEPLIGSLLISAVLRRNTTTIPMLYSLFVMNTGAIVLAGSDSSSAVCLLSVIVSSVSLVARDVTLKQSNPCHNLESVLRQYYVISMSSGASLVPMVAINRILNAAPSIWSHNTLVALVTHIVYTVMALAFLHSTSFPSFCNLNLSARFFIMLACMVYYPGHFTWISHVGFALMFTGATIYSKTSEKSELDKRKAAVVVVVLCLFVFCLTVHKYFMIPGGIYVKVI